MKLATIRGVVGALIVLTVRHLAAAEEATTTTSSSATTTTGITRRRRFLADSFYRILPTTSSRNSDLQRFNKPHVRGGRDDLAVWNEVLHRELLTGGGMSMESRRLERELRAGSGDMSMQN